MTENGSANNPPISVSGERTTVATFEITFTRMLDIDGRPVNDSLPDWTRDPEVVLPIYRTMVLTRVFDARALNMQRTGQLGTYGSPLGQEAIGAAVASCMTPDDVLLPSYREFSAQLYRGVTMTELLLYWGGDERGSDYAGPRNDFPVSIPIATQTLHAAGVACAFKYRKQANAAVCCLGDGATSKGDFYEAINLAAVWRLPVVFVVSNNQWAISVPRSHQSATLTLAQKAIGAGMEGEQVDGNDALAVRAVMQRAITTARNHQKPSLIEAITYRMSNHTTADDASRYRDPSDVEKHGKEDPITRLRAYLNAAGLWTQAKEQALLAECEQAVDKAVAEYQSIPPQRPEAMFDYLYARLPEALTAQRQAAQEQVDD